MSYLWLATYTTVPHMTYYSVSLTYIGDPPCTSTHINDSSIKNYEEHYIEACSVNIDTLKDTASFGSQYLVSTNYTVNTVIMTNDTAQFIIHIATCEDPVHVGITTINCYNCDINTNKLQRWSYVDPPNIYIYISKQFSDVTQIRDREVHIDSNGGLIFKSYTSIDNSTVYSCGTIRCTILNSTQILNEETRGCIEGDYMLIYGACKIENQIIKNTVFMLQQDATIEVSNCVFEYDRRMQINTTTYNLIKENLVLKEGAMIDNILSSNPNITSFVISGPLTKSEGSIVTL